MSTAPEKIYLQDDDGYHEESGVWGDTTWCTDQIDDTDVEYVRADLVTSLREQLRKERWISVKDRLPELKYRDDSKVPGGAAATLYSESIMVFDGRIRIDHFIQAEGVEGTGTFYVGSRKPVTHWMPLPTPPAESTEGG
jgi:hypothetical protein